VRQGERTSRDKSSEEDEGVQTLGGPTTFG
jgi:hypothetical protein